MKNSNLLGLIPSCTFINFGKFQAETPIFTNKKWKIPTCTALFQPARLLSFWVLPACTFIPSCTIIRETRVRKSLHRRIYVLFFQLWRLVFLETPRVQRHIVAHFKGLIDANQNLKSSRVWHYFYLLPHPFENSHFTL